jgi:hypothetical protein
MQNLLFLLRYAGVYFWLPQFTSQRQLIAEPFTALSKSSVGGRWLAGIAGSNFSMVMHVW